MLVIGAIPNAPNSIENIINQKKSDFRYFTNQRMYSEQDNEGKVTWDPIHYPPPAWRPYQELFHMFGDKDKIAFANFFLWGGDKFTETIEELASKTDCHARAINFCNNINSFIIEKLQPKAIFVFLSYARNSNLSNSHLFLSNESKKDKVILPTEVLNRRFTFAHRKKSINKKYYNLFFLAHPSGFRVNKKAKDLFIKECIKRVHAALG